MKKTLVLLLLASLAPAAAFTVHHFDFVSGLAKGSGDAAYQKKVGLSYQVLPQEFGPVNPWTRLELGYEIDKGRYGGYWTPLSFGFINPEIGLWNFRKHDPRAGGSAGNAGITPPPRKWHPSYGVELNTFVLLSALSMGYQAGAGRRFSFEPYYRYTNFWGIRDYRHEAGFRIGYWAPGWDFSQ